MPGEFTANPILKSAPSDGQVLQYEAATDRWIPVALGSLPAAVIPQTHIAPEADPSAQTAVAVATTAPTNVSPYGFAQAQAAAILTNLNANTTDVAATIATLEDLIDQFNTLLTELQTAGILASS